MTWDEYLRESDRAACVCAMVKHLVHLAALAAALNERQVDRMLEGGWKGTRTP